MDSQAQPHIQLDGASQLAFHLTPPQAQSPRLQFTKHSAHFYSRLATHKRLFHRLRRRQHTLRELHLVTSTKHHALTILRDLTKHTSAPFEAAKQLRSGRHTDLEVYAIRRVAANLEEPGRSRALHIVHQALQYRNLTPPRPNIPLTVPFLAHDDFLKHTQQWLQTTIQQHKHLAIPLHLPTHRLREAAYKTLRAQLRNHRQWEETLHTFSPPFSSPSTRHSHHQWTLHSHPGPATSPCPPSHLSRCQHEQRFLPQQSPLLSHLSSSLSQMAQTTRPPSVLDPASRSVLATPMAPTCRLPQATPSLHSPCSTMLIMSFNKYACFVHASTSPERSTHGKLQNSLNHYLISHPPTSTNILQPLSPPPFDPDTNGAFAKTSPSLTASSTSKPKSQETMAEGPHHHFLLPLHGRPPLSHHQSGARHHPPP